MRLTDKDTISLIGKEESVTIHYTNEASREDHLKILTYFFNLDHVNTKEIDYFLLTGKKRLSANVIRFLDVKSSNDKLYTINYEGDVNIDLMNLAIVNQYSIEGETMISITKDPLILEFEFVVVYIHLKILSYLLLKEFKKIERDGIKSQTKGISFEWIILAYFLEKDIQNLPLSQLPFLKRIYQKNIQNGLTMLFLNVNFGTKQIFRNSDIETLKNIKNIILKPDDKMHPDGIMCFFDQGKYYFLNVCCKISALLSFADWFVRIVFIQ